MKIGFSIFLFLLCLNIASTLVFDLRVPGTEYAKGMYEGTQTDYETEFNATGFAETWPAKTSLLSFIGDILSGVIIYVNKVTFLITGFPTMIIQMGSVIPDSDARAAVTLFSTALTAIFSFVMTTWVFQIISGRKVSD